MNFQRSTIFWWFYVQLSLQNDQIQGRSLNGGGKSQRPGEQRPALDEENLDVSSSF